MSPRPRKPSVPVPDGYRSSLLGLVLSEHAWLTLHSRAQTQLRSIEAEASVLLEQVLIPARAEGKVETATSTAPAGLSDAERAELDGYERRGLLARKPDGGYQCVYRQGRRWKAGVSMGGRGNFHYLGTYETQDEAALVRGRYLAEKARKDRQVVLDQERSLQAFMRSEIIGHPAYSDWLQDEVDEHAPKVPCPFEYGVDYEVDPGTLEVVRASDGKVIVHAGGVLAGRETHRLRDEG